MGSAGTDNGGARKILIAAMALDIGGAETHVVDLTRELTRRGNSVTVVSAGGVFEADILAFGAEHVRAPLNTRNPVAMLRALKVLRREIRRVQPDVVHAHARIPAFLCGLIWKRNRRFRFVTTAHWVFHVDKLTRILSDWGEKTLAVSEDIKRYLMDNYGTREKNIIVTVNGVDTEKFSPGTDGAHIRRELDIPESAPVVSYISRLDDVAGEGARCLIDAAPELARIIPELRIIITGGAVASDGMFAAALLASADKVNADLGYPAVIMTGPRTDVGGIIAACDVYVGVSRSALEALAAAKPVILAGGEGYLGLFTPDKRERAAATNFTCRGIGETSPELLIDELTRFYERPVSEYGELARFGRELVIENYSVARMADDCEACYAEAEAANGTRHVVMSGYYGFRNAGDEAILKSVLGAIEMIPGCAVTVLTKTPKATRETHGCRAAGRFNPVALVYALMRADALVFGGGSLLQDNTSTRSLLYYLTILRLARLFRVKTMIYANGIGPVSRPANRRRVARAVSRADVVTLRDSASLEELAAMGVPREGLTVTSDPVFLTEAPGVEESEEITAALGLSRPYAVFALRGGAPPRLLDEIAILADMVSGSGIEVVFVPMQFPSDTAAGERVSSRMKNPARVLSEAISARKILGILRRAEAVFTMRLHMLILAALADAPAAGLDVDPKVRAFLNELGLPNLGDPGAFDAENAFRVMRGLAEDRESYSARLTETSRALAERARRDAELLRELLWRE